MEQIERWVEEQQAIILELKQQEDLLNELNKPPEDEEGEGEEGDGEEKERGEEEEKEHYYSDLYDFVSILLAVIQAIINLLFGIENSKSSILSQGDGVLSIPEVIIT